jgi:hypothetical protein
MVEDQRRIRDILVTISVVTKLYRQANIANPSKNGDPVGYLSLKSFCEKDAEFFLGLIPKMNDDQYVDWKTQVLEAE